MAKRKRDHHEYLARVAAAARLAAEGNDQTLIAKRLGGISQAGVSRLLADAEKKRWLVRTPRVAEHRIPREIRQLAELHLYPHDLLKLIRSHEGYEDNKSLREILVFESGSDNSSAPSIDRRLREFGRAVAPRLQTLLQRVQTCALTWGRTLSCAIDGLSGVYTEPRDEPLSFVPVCGDPLGDVSMTYSSSRLAARLSEIVNGPEGSEKVALSLTGVPAFVPLNFPTDECATVKKLIRRMSSFDEIFPPEDTRDKRGRYLLGKTQLLLTSLGPAARSLGYSRDMLLKTAGIRSEQLRELVIGDVGGVLLERANLTDAQQGNLKIIREHWMGIKLQHLEDIRDRSDIYSTPGVVVLAVGRDKRNVILECIRRGLIQHLWIDRDLANALYTKLVESSEDTVMATS